MAALDAMRFIAVCAVVWIHTTETLTPTTIWARWAVPYFTIASIWLIGQSLSRRPGQKFSGYAVRRTIRLYGTFLLWDAIYLLLIAFKHAAFHAGKSIVLAPDLLWGGAAEHLWFLTFLWIASVAAFPIVQLAARGKSWAIGVAVLSLLAGVVLALSSMPNVGRLSPATGAFAGYVWLALPSLCIGVAMACGRVNADSWPTAGDARAGKVLRWNSAMVVCGAVMLVAAQICLYRHGRDAGLEAAAGFGAMLIGLSAARRSIVRALANGGQYAFGIYVVHVMWVELLQALCARVAITPSPALDFTVWIVSIAISLAMCRVLKRTFLIPR